MFKCPKTVLICGRPYKVKLDPTHDGGQFSETDQTIVVGTISPSKIPDIFLHEVVEAVMALRNYRYVVQRGELDNGDYRFFLNHTEYELLITDVANSLAGISFPKIGK